MTIASHTRLDHSEILSLLGKGGRRRNFLARNARLSRNVARACQFVSWEASV
jgi:hypothetical protein